MDVGGAFGAGGEVRQRPEGDGNGPDDVAVVRVDCAEFGVGGAEVGVVRGVEG